MKFLAKKSDCCIMAGHVCHELESENEKIMADYILAAFAFGCPTDRRDDDYSFVCDSLATFENERFAAEDDRGMLMNDYCGTTNYSDLPKDSKLLYVANSCGWYLIPISTQKDIIHELTGIEWPDLRIEYTE